MILEAKTNSNRCTPEAMTVNQEQLDNLIEKFAPHFHDSAYDIQSVNTFDEPDCSFTDSNGEVCDSEISQWEHVNTMVGKDSVTVVYVHTEDGSELFCEYKQG